MQRLRTLPERLQVVVGMRAFGWKYAEIAEELGVSRVRVDQLLRQADERLNKFRERDLADRHPRTARLRELEDDPPPYLRMAIGRPPRPNRRRGGGGELLRDWRRLALAIDDHRDRYGVTDPKRALGIFGRNVDERRDRDLLRVQIDRFLYARERFDGLDR